MAKQNIEFAIGSKFSGEGFQKLDSALKGSSKGVAQFSHSVTGVLGQMDALPGKAGNAAKAVGDLVSSGLKMGVWGLAIQGATMAVGALVKKVKNYYDEINAANKAWAEHKKIVVSLDDILAGYKRRVQSYIDADKAAAEADKKLAEEKRRSRERGERVMKAAYETEQKWQSLDHQLILEKMKASMMDENAVKSAEAKLAYAQKELELFREEAKLKMEAAQKTGGVEGPSTARREIALRDQALQNQVASAEKMLKVAIAKEQAEKKAEEAKLAALQQRQQIEEAMAKRREEMDKIREEGAKRIKAIEGQIADAKLRAAALEAEAAKARGVSVGEWLRSGRDEDRAKRTADRKQANREKAAQRELTRLESMNPKLMTRWQKERMANLKTFLLNQNPENNPALKDLEKLQKNRDEIQRKIQRDIADIAADIKNKLGT